MTHSDAAAAVVLRAQPSVATIGHVEPDRLVEREEIVAMLFAIADLNAKVGQILQLLEEELGGGEALPEDDT